LYVSTAQNKNKSKNTQIHKYTNTQVQNRVLFLIRQHQTSGASAASRKAVEPPQKYPANAKANFTLIKLVHPKIIQRTCGWPMLYPAIYSSTDQQ
jgi:hypothetical protein